MRFEISGRLAHLEETRDQPIVVPGTRLSLTRTSEGEFLEFAVVNAGGGCVIDLWIEQIGIVDQTKGGVAAWKAEISQRVPYLRTESMVHVKLRDGHGLQNPEVVLKLLGTYVNQSGRKHELAYSRA